MSRTLQDGAAPQPKPESQHRYATRSRLRTVKLQTNESSSNVPDSTESKAVLLSSNFIIPLGPPNPDLISLLSSSSPDPIYTEPVRPRPRPAKHGSRPAKRKRTIPTAPTRRSRRLENKNMHGFANDDPFDLTLDEEAPSTDGGQIVALNQQKRLSSLDDSPPRKRARMAQSGPNNDFGDSSVQNHQEHPQSIDTVMEFTEWFHFDAPGPSNSFEVLNTVWPIEPTAESSLESSVVPSTELSEVTSMELSAAPSTQISTEPSVEPSAEPSTEPTREETTETPDANDSEDLMEATRVTRFRGRRRPREPKVPRATLRIKLKEKHPKLLTMWKELEDMPIIEPKEAPQPTGISRRLKPFQRQGLNWMMEMEKTKWKGGLLGDEMGLGKTIQAVSLIMSDFPANKPSLVLVPPVALMQWVTEIESYTNGKLRTFVYHNSRSEARNITVEKLKEYDVIMMSYNSLESLYRRQTVGTRHGPRGSEATMVKRPSQIHEIEFHRVILDEAHEIKTRTTSTAKACFALKSTYRWCLSGTPLQNRIGELFSLLRFINIEPFASYFCLDCDCESLEWSMDSDKQCTQCHCRSMAHLSIFNQELLNPIQEWGTQGPGAEAFRKLRLLTDRLMLRRQKKDHMEAMELPVKEMRVSREFFGDAEKDLANSIMNNSQRKFDTYVARGVLLNNYANIFGLIMQMRQVADHPDLILRRKGAEVNDGVIECAICEQPAEDTIQSNCRHHYCRMCVTELVESSPECSCTRCHIPLVIDLEQPAIGQDPASMKNSSIVNRISRENWTSSTKIELLLHELYMLRSDSETVKVIIFSQFTSMLQLIEWRLRHAGFTTVMLDGSMTPAQRAASIKHFMENVDVECFLVSLKAGGVALNLTEASRVFLIEPWWNPAVEWQSADRCHRIGQSRPCTITNLVIEDSVESRMVLLQEKKARMIRSTINDDKKAMDSLKPQDLMFLFRGN